MFGFYNGVSERLDKIEDHMTLCEERSSKTKIVEIELTSQLKDITRFFKEYTERSEIAMKEHTKREEQNAYENTAILLNIKEDITSIKTDLTSQPKDVAILLMKQHEEIKEYADKEFATKIELTDGLTALRKQAKVIWIVGLTCLAGFAWAFDKMIPLIDLTKLLK